jgi:hypothetical protein
VAAASATLARAAPAGDIVTTIPGFGAPVSPVYSGYLPAGANQQLHYVYTSSLVKPSTDPVVLWLNGGPGCSSMEGLFSESGLCACEQRSVDRGGMFDVKRRHSCAVAAARALTLLRVARAAAREPTSSS